MSKAKVAERDPELVALERDQAVLAFVEEVEGVLLSKLMDRNPELGRMLPTCERRFIEGNNRWESWAETYEVLWGKAQRIRQLYGEPDATVARRACMGGQCDAKDCRGWNVR